MRITESITARGHKNVLATNKTTVEITKEKHLTKRGDCIIAVEADKAATDLNAKFKQAAKDESAQITMIIRGGGYVEKVKAWGNPGLSFTHPTDLVVRKSNYTCSRTLAVRADKAAQDLSRRLAERLRDPNERVIITLIVETAS